MDFIKKILQHLFHYLQLILLLFYIILEELIWEQFAKPIYYYIINLRIAVKFEQFLKKQNRYIPLIFFLSTFIVGEIFGLAIPFFLANGLLIFAILVYFFKVLIVAFAFWLFKIEKDRLLSFKIINYLYEKIIYFNEKIKNSELYKSVVIKFKNLKAFIKAKVRYVKGKYFK